jgi:hypothetical protein
MNTLEIRSGIATATGTNEVAIWALQLYIGRFAKLPLSIPGAHDVHSSNRLQPRDQHPTAYIMAVSRPLFILGPRGALFSRYDQVRTRIVTVFKIQAQTFDTLQILVTLGIWLLCVQEHAHRSSTSSLQVYLQHWHVVSPTELHLHLQSHPLILTFRILIPGSAVPQPPFFLHQRYCNPVAFSPT